MIVCLCEAVTDRQVREAIQGGCDSVRAVQRRCGAGASCGSCCGMVREMIASRRNRRVAVEQS